ncbi:DM13 domain-containing protein [Pyruvatibacter mobilis]|uniref:DM13 domain-containing protein n=1 Tax=Pyruvatibacter mobilis TaxID=1712261 RepID=UPI003BA8AFAC
MRLIARLKTLTAATLVALAGLAAAALPAASPPASAQEAPARSGFDVTAERIDGSWSLETRADGTYLLFNEDFSTASGPDLKVFLSPQEVTDVRDRTATRNAVKLGALKRTSGAQEYRLPDGIDLSAFRSLLIHCERYSHFWGGAAL